MVRTAWQSLAGVLRNPDIRALEASWTVGYGVDWAILVLALVVAYEVGGPLAVGLTSLARMVPALVVNVLFDTSATARPERVLVAAQVGRAAGAAAMAVFIVLGQPLATFAAVAVASAAGSLVRPTTLALLPSVAVTPDELVSANTAGAFGESLGTFLGPLVTGIAVAQSGPAAGAVLAAVAGAAAAIVAARIAVAPAARAIPVAPKRGVAVAAGIRELRRRPPAGVVMASFGAQVIVRGAVTSFLAILAIETLGMGDSGVGLLGAAIGAGGIVGAAVALGLGTGGSLAALFAVALVAWGAPVAAIGVVPLPAVAIGALAITGVGNALLDVAGLTLLQRGTSNAARGAVFALLEVVAAIGVCVGALAAPALVETIGVRTTLIVTGLLLPIVAIVGRPWVRRLDREGVVPEQQARLLRGVPLFASLPLAGLERLAAGMRQVHYDSGAQLMIQGETGDTFVVVEKGQVEVSIDGVRRRQEGAGEGFGEIALLRAVPRTATVTALEPVDGWSIDCRTFVEAVTGHEGSRTIASELVQRRLDADGTPA
ncbi:MAG: cyclic nucleotide-binding domain-containing protein [Chloroflexota bacterium]